MRHYTIRYRRTDPSGETLLIVDDEQGAAYLFAGGQLRQRLEGGEAGGRLAREPDPDARWVRVPAVAPYTLIELHRITAVPSGAAPSTEAAVPRRAALAPVLRPT